MIDAVEVSMAIALLQYLRALEPDSAFTLSYPNDVYKNGKKIAGILAEVAANVVVGVGFN